MCLSQSVSNSNWMRLNLIICGLIAPAEHLTGLNPLWSYEESL